MSFDELRNALPGRDLWILVLDTKGINVWCAAGKGTFGTEELVKRIASSGLSRIVGHRSLILPQLGAPGVAAHRVKKLSGFGVRYGPIKAKDLPAYLDSGYKATEAMRLKTFPLKERAVLIPIELVETIKPTLIIAPVLFLLAGIGGPGGFWANALRDGSFAVMAFVSAVVAGSVLNPLLLPYLPGRAFSTKGLWLGAAVAVAVLALTGADLSIWAGRLGVAGVAADHPGRNCVSRHEFYRGIDVYVTFRREPGDALGASPGDRHGAERSRRMGCIARDRVGG